MLIKQSYRIVEKSDISLVMFSPGSAKTSVGWGGKLDSHRLQVVSEIFLLKIITIW